MNGGYILIDCKGLDLTLGDTPQTISGLYAECLSAMKKNKPVYACGLKWGTLDVTPVQTFGIQMTSTQQIWTASTLQIKVNSDDSVTIGNMAPSANRTTKSTK